MSRFPYLSSALALALICVSGSVRADIFANPNNYPGQPGATYLANSNITPTDAPPASPSSALPAQSATNQTTNAGALSFFNRPSQSPNTAANTAAAAADRIGRINITEENDYFFSHNDRHYTQGARASFLSAAVTPGGFWDAPYNLLSDTLPIYEGGDFKRKYDWTVVGQSIFTPQNTALTKNGPKTWPYGAWLYTGAGLLQEDKRPDHNTLENFEVLGGIVGPGAFGNVTQNDFHEFIGVQPSRGWQNQLHNEPGLAVTYERKWRYQQPLVANFAVDAIPELGATVGNVFTYGETGGYIRFGQNLGADYGPSHVRPSLSGTSWFDKTQLLQPLGWYVFAGTQGRVVGRDIFLDGNTFQTSPHVTHEPLVADFLLGASAFYSDKVRFDATWISRTPEFVGQKGHDQFGSFDVSFLF